MIVWVLRSVVLFLLTLFVDETFHLQHDSLVPIQLIEHDSI